MHLVTENSRAMPSDHNRPGTGRNMAHHVATLGPWTIDVVMFNVVRVDNGTLCMTFGTSRESNLLPVATQCHVSASDRDDVDGKQGRLSVYPVSRHPVKR
jgi:hypothetical protein